MSQSVASNANQHRWTETDAPRGRYRTVSIVSLSALIAAGTALMIWYVSRVEPRPQTHLVAWYGGGDKPGDTAYDNSVLFELPFAKPGAQRFLELGAKQGLRNVVSRLAATQLRGKQSVRQAAEALVGRFGPRGKEAFRKGHDSLLVYIRAHAIGQTVEGGKPRIELLAGDVLHGGVPLEELFDRLAELQTAAVVVMLDSSEIETALPLGVLANGFADALQTLMRRGENWDRLWVITGNAFLEPGHFSWSRRQSLLLAASTPDDWGSDDRDQNGWVTLAEFYERLLRFCDQETGGRQTPQLFRGGVGLCRPEQGDAAWDGAGKILLFDRADAAAIEGTSGGDGGEGTGVAQGQQGAGATGAVGDGRTEISGRGATGEGEQKANAAASLPVVPPQGVGASSTEGPTAPDTKPTAPDTKPTAPDTKPTAPPATADRQGGSPPDKGGGAKPDGGDDAPSKEQADGVGAAAKGAVAIDFGRSPRGATWEKFDRLNRREASGGWSPVDYAPSVWNIIRRELVSLDHQERMWGDGRETGVSGETLAMWKEYDDLFAHLLRPDASLAPPKPRDSRQRLLEGWRSSGWQERRARWESDQSVGPDEQESWLRVRNTIRSYSDAMAELGWWLNLAAGLRSTPLLQKSDRLGLALRDARVTLEVATIEPLDVGDADLRHQRAIDEARGELLGELESLIERLPEAASWERDRQIDHLLRSPLLYREVRDRLEGMTANRPDPVMVVRDQPLIGLWRPNGGDQGWAFIDRLARSYGELWSWVAEGIGRVDPKGMTGERIDDNVGLQRWQQRYANLVTAIGSPTAEETRSPFEAWRVGAISGPYLPRLSLRGDEVAPMVIIPALKLRTFPAVPKGLMLKQVGMAEKFEPVRLSVAGAPERCVLRVEKTSKVPAWGRRLRLSVGGQELSWEGLLGDGVSVPLGRDKEIQLEATIEKEDPPFRGESPVRLDLEIAVGDERAKATFRVEPPLVDRVVLWVTPAADAEVGKSVARGGQPADFGDELFAVDRGLLTIPSHQAGVPYHLWLENRSAQPRNVRARIYSIDPRTALRPGRIVDHGSGIVDEAVRESVVSDIQNGRIKAWAEAFVELPAGGSGRIPDEIDTALPAQAVKLTFSAVKPPTAEGQGDELEIPHGFLCQFNEVVPEQVGSDPKQIRWSDSTSDPWTEWAWVEVGSHWIAGRSNPWDLPLVEVSRPEMKGPNIEFTVTSDLAAWGRYGLEKLPLTVEVNDQAGRIGSFVGRNRWELSREEPEAKVRLTRESTAPPAETDWIHLTIGGYPRRISYSRGREEQDSGFSPRDDAKRAELVDVVPMTADEKPAFEQMRLPSGESAKVLLHSQEVDGKRKKVEYKQLLASALFDAPWNKFHDFGTDQVWDRAEVVLRNRRTGEALLKETRYSPRSERYRLRLNPDLGAIQLVAAVEDHTGLVLGLSGISDGTYDAVARLVIGGDVVASSVPRAMIIDNKPPGRGVIRRRVSAGKRSEDREIWEGKEKFEVVLSMPKENELSEITRVEFGLLDGAGKRIGAISWVAREVNAGEWVVAIDPEDLKKANLVGDRYFLTASSIDLAGNIQTSNGEYEVVWMNRPRPTQTGGGGGGVTEPDGAVPATYQVSLAFTRNDQFPIESGFKDLWNSIGVKNLPGRQVRRGNQIRFEEVPAGSYEVEVTGKMGREALVGKRTLVVPRDTEEVQVITINLLPEEK